MTVLITGATGLLGSAIVEQCLMQDIKVNYLTTSSKKLETRENYRGFLWNPSKQEINTACFSGVSTIIHLAGASIAKRWTDDYKKEIISSRVLTTQLLLRTLQTTTHEVKHVISASAIGIYPSSQSNYYKESDEIVSDSFLGEVVKKWETAVNEFKVLDIDVAKVRIGIVLSSKGGALPQIAKPIKFGAGAAMGNGKQWQSWIHINDLASIFMHVLHNSLTGIYNGVAPIPVKNFELTKAVAKQLNRPLVLPNIPEFVMKMILGEMHILLFESQKVSSNKIEESGYVFKYQNLQLALSNLYN